MTVPFQATVKSLSGERPDMAELLKFAGKVKEQRKATAEKLFTDRVMTREELIKHGLLPDKYVN